MMDEVAVVTFLATPIVIYCSLRFVKYLVDSFFDDGTIEEDIYSSVGISLVNPLVGRTEALGGGGSDDQTTRYQEAAE